MNTDSPDKMPTYEVMLEMNADDFKKWVLLRSEKPNRDKFLEEMIEHEEKTHSFRKTGKAELTDGEQITMNVFDREMSRGVVAWLEKMNEFLPEEDRKDFVLEAILAKATSDHVKLGTHREFSRFVEEEA